MATEGFKRKLTAILSADVEGYSRLMGEDEEATVRTLTAYREVLTTLIQQHNGKVLDSPGDNLLADFVSVVDAVQCAVAVQKEIKARNEELPETRRMQFRIGINLGDVIQEKIAYMEMASTLLPDWKAWPNPAVSAYRRRLLTTLKASCRTDTSF
jgi:adenylate cyclase